MFFMRQIRGTSATGTDLGAGALFTAAEKG